MKWFAKLMLLSSNRILLFRYGPIFYFEELARCQICEKIAYGERYDYLRLFYCLGMATSECVELVNMGLSDERLSDEIGEIRFSWECYRIIFNVIAENHTGLEDFLSSKLDDERYDKVFLRKDLLH